MKMVTWLATRRQYLKVFPVLSMYLINTSAIQAIWPVTYNHQLEASAMHTCVIAIFLVSWQESHTVNTAAFWRWSVLSSGWSPLRSSLQSTMAAGLAGRPWRSALVSGSQKLRLNNNLFIILSLELKKICFNKPQLINFIACVRVSS